MDLLYLLTEIQSHATTGLNYTKNSYDRERYEHLLALAASSYAEILDMPEPHLIELFRKEIGSITPKVGADAAIFNEKGEVLLMDRADGTGWCLPCGWVEPNEKPSQAAVREAFEETGLIVEVDRFVGVFSRPASVEYGPISMIAHVHLCNIVGGELILSHEGLDLRYWQIADVQNWHKNHGRLAEAAWQMWQADELIPAVCD
ncbi:MAG: NUDIX hydrolase N-terminal domain-containing protein [Anaerolineae bacterium]